jgi:RNA polymerase sigma-70 factor (ECF subfamily)
LRLANAALAGLNDLQKAKFVGATQRVTPTVPDNAAAGSTPCAPVEETRNDDAAAPARGASRAQIETLISREYAGLRLLIARRTRDPELAADLLNDAICTTWEKWQAGQIDRPEQIAGYVFQVAMNLLRNQRRSHGDRPDKRGDSRMLENISAEPAAEPFEQGIARQVLAIVRGMTPARDRMVIVRFYLEEEDRESICRDMGLTADQFTKILHRARRRLRELVEARGIKGTDLFAVLAMIAALG